MKTIQTPPIQEFPVLNEEIGVYRGFNWAIYFLVGMLWLMIIPMWFKVGGFSEVTLSDQIWFTIIMGGMGLLLYGISKMIFLSMTIKITPTSFQYFYGKKMKKEIFFSDIVEFAFYKMTLNVGTQSSVSTQRTSLENIQPHLLSSYNVVVSTKALDEHFYPQFGTLNRSDFYIMFQLRDDIMEWVQNNFSSYIK